MAETKKTVSKSNNNKNNTQKKSSSTKKTTAKKNTTTKNTAANNNVTKSNTAKKTKTTNSSVKKTTAKMNVNTPKKIESVVLEKEEVKVNNTPKEVEVTEIKELTEQETIEKDIYKEIENVTKVEDAKYKVTKKKKNVGLIAIGVFIVILGFAALIISLVANRIIDRAFLSDNTITIMIIISILIEVFGAFIIISES